MYRWLALPNLRIDEVVDATLCVSTDKTRKKLIFFFLSVCVWVQWFPIWFAFSLLERHFVSCMHKHIAKKSVFHLSRRPVEYRRNNLKGKKEKDWMMFVPKYFHITQNFSLFAVSRNDKQLRPISFSAFGTPLSLWCLSWKIYTDNQTGAAAYRSRSSIQCEKKEKQE